MDGNIQDVFIGGINVSLLGTPRRLQLIIDGLSSLKKHRTALIKEVTKTIAFSIKRNISAGYRFDGKRMRASKSMLPLKGSTRPLMWTGQILSGVKNRMQGSIGVIEMSQAMYRDPRKKTGRGHKAPRTTAITISSLANILQHGRQSYKPMVARPFFGLSKWGRTQAKQIVKDYITKTLEK